METKEDTHAVGENTVAAHIIEYIWTGGHNEFRSKVRIIRCDCGPDQLTLDQIPVWNYDGSSTNQASTTNSEVVLQPHTLYFDRREKKYYVLCETYKYESGQKIPLINNYRYQYVKMLKESQQLRDLDIWFGFEQEFFIYDLIKNSYLGFTVSMPEQGHYYCNVERPLSDTRKYTEMIVRKCLDINLRLTGWNLEVSPAQTEIQVFGHGLRACDDLMMLRFISHLVLAPHRLSPDFHPKPLGKEWNGSGLHTNVSTCDTRCDNGYQTIQQYMVKFANKHQEHISEYGELNDLRLTGHHETSSINHFTYEVGSRACSVRIPRETAEMKSGYFEDRRPASWANPYRVACRIIKTILETE